MSQSPLPTTQDEPPALPECEYPMEIRLAHHGTSPRDAALRGWESLNRWGMLPFVHVFVDGNWVEIDLEESEDDDVTDS